MTPVQGGALRLHTAHIVYVYNSLPKLIEWNDGLCK